MTWCCWRPYPPTNFTIIHAVPATAAAATGHSQHERASVDAAASSLLCYGTCDSLSPLQCGAVEVLENVFLKVKMAPATLRSVTASGGSVYVHGDPPQTINAWGYVQLRFTTSRSQDVPA